MLPLDLLKRGAASDAVLFYLVQDLPAVPVVSVVLGGHKSSLSLRVLATDAQGRVLVSNVTDNFDIINVALADTDTQLLTGAPIGRRIVFYAQAAKASIKFVKADGTITPYITADPDVPLTIEAIFTAVIAKNQTAGVASTIQAVVNYDTMTGL